MMSASLHMVENEGDRKILEGALSCRSEEEAKRYLLAHVDELSDPAMREGIINKVVEEMGEFEAGIKEGETKFDAALEDVQLMRKLLGDAELTRGGPSLIAGFIEKQFGRKHSVSVVTAVFKGLRIPWVPE